MYLWEKDGQGLVMKYWGKLSWGNATVTHIGKEFYGMWLEKQTEGLEDEAGYQCYLSCFCIVVFFFLSITDAKI